MIEDDEFDPRDDDADRWHDQRVDREHDMQIKRYLENVLQACSEEQTGQDAIDWAIVAGMVKLTFNFEADVQHIADHYSQIIVAYQTHLANESLLAA
jgi:hypothetical protein